MAYIEVNYKSLGQAAERISEYLSFHRQKVYEMDQAVKRVRSQWMGKDADATRKAWRQMTCKGSSNDQMQEALRTYGRNLQQAQLLYQDAQGRTVNRFRNL